MPFDAELPTPEATATVAQFEQRAALGALFERGTDPDPAWAAKNPARAMAFLFVSPRDCAAIDALLAA
ncbi:MAG: hypothetical protein JOZ27_06395 [Caulobacteraceae bacterium]|nr:hypothetical protein [Caulobacteraceae bacterium]